MKNLLITISLIFFISCATSTPSNHDDPTPPDPTDDTLYVYDGDNNLLGTVPVIDDKLQYNEYYTWVKTSKGYYDRIEYSGLNYGHEYSKIDPNDPHNFDKSSLMFYLLSNKDDYTGIDFNSEIYIHFKDKAYASLQPFTLKFNIYNVQTAVYTPARFCEKTKKKDFDAKQIYPQLDKGGYIANITEVLPSFFPQRNNSEEPYTDTFDKNIQNIKENTLVEVCTNTDIGYPESTDTNEKLKAPVQIRKKDGTVVKG